MAIPTTTPVDKPSEEGEGGEGEDGVRGDPPPGEGLDGGPGTEGGGFRVGVTGAGGDPGVVGAGGDG